MAKKYFLDSDPFDKDVFFLKTCDEEETVFFGRLSDVSKCDGNDSYVDILDVLDHLFEEKLGISTEDWVVG